MATIALARKFALMWPMHKLSTEARDAARYCAENSRQLMNEEWFIQEQIGLFQFERRSKEENEQHANDLLARAFGDRPKPLTALEQEIRSHLNAFKLRVALYRLKRARWRSARTWTVFILTVLGFITLAQILQSTLEPVIGRRGIVIVFFFLFLLPFFIMERCAEEERQERRTKPKQ